MVAIGYTRCDVECEMRGAVDGGGDGGDCWFPRSTKGARIFTLIQNSL